MAELTFDAAVAEALVERDAPRRRRMLLGLRVPLALSPATARAIEAGLKDETDIGARLAATDVLAAVGEIALPLVEALLTEPSPGVRRLAVDTLGLIPSRRALQVLESATNDSSAAVRSAALDSMARIGGEAAIAALKRQVDAPSTPASVALAALLGIEQLGAVAPSSSLQRWLTDPLTVGAALRLLGRAGDAEAILPSLRAVSPTRQRAAVLGLADALERGAAAPKALRQDLTRAQLATHVAKGDWPSASAALIVLAHVGDMSSLATAAMRDDRVRLLPALHRVVELAGSADAIAALVRSVDDHPEAAEVLRELADAASLRRRETPRTMTPSPERKRGRYGARAPITDDEFARLTAWFERVAGLLVTPEARARVEARLGARLEATGKHDFGRYLVLLESGDSDERIAAIEALTVHETYFFREPVALTGFQSEIVPAVAAVRGRSLRVWSAGCSTGEEAYTIAILLEQLKAKGVVDDYEVWGTDISPQAIARARDAHYPHRSFRTKLEGDDDAYFFDDARGRVPVARVLARTRFEVVNLVDKDSVARLPKFDVVFCRNVLIYFSPLARRTAVEAFHERLNPGGALLLGHSESLLHVENPFEPWPLKRGLAYRRSEP